MAVKKAAPAKATAASTEDEQVAISPIARERILVPIVGTSPLIVHRFGYQEFAEFAQMVTRDIGEAA